MKPFIPAAVFFLTLAGAAPEDPRPELLREALPTYPKNAQSMDITGWVILEYDVNEKGEPENIRVVDSHDEGPIKSKYVRQNFENNSIKAMKKFRYAPGQPVQGLLHRFSFGVYVGHGSILRREMLLTGGDVEG